VGSVRGGGEVSQGGGELNMIGNLVRGVGEGGGLLVAVAPRHRWKEAIGCGLRPMLTPSSVTGTWLEITRRLSSGWSTMAQRPKPTGARVGLKPDMISFGVSGEEALHIG